MSINPAIQDLATEAQNWRRDIHQHPELDYDVHRTAALVADQLTAFGCDEVVTGIGRTGVVARIKGRGPASERTIGLRADMDALPIHETTNLPYRSATPGKMHACGHDGHTAMLLGAARYLAQTRNFSGTAVVIFQPAEEGGAGGKAMLDDGMMERFNIQEVYGMHNMPTLPVGAFAIRKGAFLAAADRFTIDIEGRGAHAAYPHRGVDPILGGRADRHRLAIDRRARRRSARFLRRLRHQIRSRHRLQHHSANRAAYGNDAHIEERNAGFRAKRRISEIAKGVGAALGVNVDVDYWRGYPPTRNHPEQTDFAAAVARKIVGDDSVVTEAPPTMGAEDFSYMLEARPGAFILIGNGDTAGLHHPAYDFNDAALPYGMSYWAQLVETALPRLRAHAANASSALMAPRNSAKPFRRPIAE